MGSWESRGGVGVESSWKVRGKFEGEGFESAWKVRGRGLRKVLEIKCEGAAWNVRGRCVGGRGYGL